MADLNANIILGGQQFDLMGAMNNGLAMADRQNALARQQEIENLYRSQGNALMQGDPNALAQLAQYDPAGAMGLRETQQQMDYRTEDQQYQREERKRATEEYAKGLTAEQRAAEASQLEAEIKRALTAPTPEAFDAMMVQMGRPELVGQFDNRQSLASDYMSMAEVLKSTTPATPEWRNATPEEAAQYGATAGQINSVTGKFEAEKPASGMALTTNPDGSVTFEQGPGVVNGRTGKPTEGSLASEGYLQRMQKAEGIFKSLETEGTKSLGYTDKPFVDTDLESWKLKEPEQMLLQAQRDWVRAKLRKESGAVIGPEEMAAEIKQYFPQPGDGPRTIAQKIASRKAAEEQLRITAMLPEGDQNSPPPDGAFDPAEIDQLMIGP